MIVYNGVIEKLAQAGYSSYRIQKECLIPNSTLTRIRNDRPISTDTLDTICALLKCQPGDLLTWVPDREPGE